MASAVVRLVTKASRKGTQVMPGGWIVPTARRSTSTSVPSMAALRRALRGVPSRSSSGDRGAHRERAFGRLPMGTTHGSSTGRGDLGALRLVRGARGMRNDGCELGGIVWSADRGRGQDLRGGRLEGMDSGWGVKDAMVWTPLVAPTSRVTWLPCRWGRWTRVCLRGGGGARYPWRAVSSLGVSFA